jgi:hypothetical protein
MIFLLALIPATALTVAGYVALFLSHRSEGALRSFGRYLGIWAFILAGLVALGGMFAAGHMHRMHGQMWGTHDGRYCPWMEDRDSDRGWERHESGGPGAPPEGAAAVAPEAKTPAGQTPPPPSGR